MEADLQQSSMREEATNQSKKERRGKPARSTKKGNANISANARIYQSCMDIFKYLQKEDKNNIFARPVDEEAHFAPNYYDVIKEPMDLNTLHGKLRIWGQDKEANNTADEFAACVRLMFRNAMTYNDSPTHPVHIAAKVLLEKFENKFLEVKQLQEGAQRKEKQKGIADQYDEATASRGGGVESTTTISNKEKSQMSKRERNGGADSSTIKAITVPKKQRAQSKSEQQEKLSLVSEMMSSLQEQMIQMSQHMNKMEQQMNKMEQQMNYLSTVVANLAFVDEGGEEKKDESIKGRNQSRGPKRERSTGQAASKVNNRPTKKPDVVAAASSSQPSGKGRSSRSRAERKGSSKSPPKRRSNTPPKRQSRRPPKTSSPNPLDERWIPPTNTIELDDKTAGEKDAPKKERTAEEEKEEGEILSDKHSSPVGNNGHDSDAVAAAEDKSSPLMNFGNEQSGAEEEENINDTDVNWKVGGGDSDDDKEEDMSTDDVLLLENAKKQAAYIAAQNADKKRLKEKNVAKIQENKKGMLSNLLGKMKKEEGGQEKSKDETKDDQDRLREENACAKAKEMVDIEPSVDIGDEQRAIMEQIQKECFFERDISGGSFNSDPGF